MANCALCGADGSYLACDGCGRSYCQSHAAPAEHACPSLDRYTEADHRVAIGFTPAETADEQTRTNVRAQRLHRENPSHEDSREPPSPITLGESDSSGDHGRVREAREPVSPPTRTDWLREITGKVALVLLVVVLIVCSAVAFGSFSLVRATGMATLEPVDQTLDRAGQHLRAALPVLDGPEPVSSVFLSPADTDGDRLPDTEEGTGAFSAASPEHKDLYVRLVLGADAKPVPTYLQRDIVEAFAEMPVGNPDGTRGIEVHIVAVDRMADPLEIPADPDDVEVIVEQIPADDTGVPCQTLHTVVVADFDRDFAGRGTAPGTFSYVDRSQAAGYRGDTAFVGTVVHELLHNIVGQRLPDTDGTGTAHSTEGWLRSRHYGAGSGHFLSTASQAVLNDGYATVHRDGWTCAV